MLEINIVFILSIKGCVFITQGVDSSYHVWNNMSARRGIIWGINVQNIYKQEVLFLSTLYI